MKKFLIFLAIILAVTGIGFGTYFLVKDNESFKVLQTTIYLDEGEDFKIDYEWADQKVGSKFSVEVENEDIVKHLADKSEDGKEFFTAVSGGYTVVLFKPTNSRLDNLVVNVYVGDGSLLSPYYISTPQQLLKIGEAGEDQLNLHTLDKYYKQINDIDMAGVAFTPIGAGISKGFTGEYDGNGYKISNLSVNHSNFEHITDNLGMFDSIGPNGRVVNLKIQNALVKSESNNIGLVGTIAGENYGEIERVEILSSTISVRSARAIGGVVGGLFSSDSGPGLEHTRYAGEIDRVGVNNINIGVDYVYNESGDYVMDVVGASGAVGGIAGEAIGGVIVYSYVKGEVYLNNDINIFYGGLVGYSENIEYSDNPDNKYTYTQEGIRIRDSYSSIKLNLSEFIKDIYEDENITDKQQHINQASIGGVIGVLHDELLAADSPLLVGVYKIFGTYYNDELFTNHNEIFGGLEDTFDKEDMIDLSTGVGRYYIKNKFEITKDKLDPNLGEINEKTEIYFPHNYETFIFGMQSEDFTVQSNFVSHYQYDRVLVDSEVKLKEKLIYWNFESPWSLSESVNGGYPYLNYENVLLSNSVEAINKNEIHNAEQLQNMKLDGHYVIVNDIVWPKNPNEGLSEDDEAYDHESQWKPWLPIGDENRPFTGSLQSAYTIDEQGNKRLFTISNLLSDPSLLDEEISRKYGGLFGVTSAESGGYIKNLVIKQANITGYLTSGVLVGSNGFEEVSNSGDKSTIHKGLDITNVTILSSTVDGLEVVGGIAGKNYGNIKGGVLTESFKVNEENIPVSDGKTSIKLLQDAKMNAAGGITGLNQGTISKSFVEGGTEISVDESENTVRIGGIAGRNFGEIIEVGVYGKTTIRGSVLSYKPTSGEEGEEQVIDKTATSGLFGGIAGEVYQNGKISKSFVREISISADFKDNTVYVGGIAGKLSGAKSLISEVSVNSVALTGYAVGGAVGEIDMSNSYDYSFGADGNLVLSNKNTLSMTLVEVKDSSVLTGAKVGGLISVMRNGIVSKSFVRETALNGVDANSFKAGLVAELPRVIKPKEKAGVIQEVYVATTFGGEGSDYAMSQSEFLQTPIVKSIPFTNVVFEKPHGFVVNYLFDKSINGKASEPKTSNWFELQFSKITHTLNNLISWIPKYGKLSAKTTEDMFIEKSYTDFNFEKSGVWRFSSSESRYPELIALEGLEERLVKNNINVTLPNNSLFDVVPLIQGLTQDSSQNLGGKLIYTYKLNNGESFHFELQFSPDVNIDDYVITVTVDGDVLNPIKTEENIITYNTNYLFDTTEIVITFEEK